MTSNDTAERLSEAEIAERVAELEMVHQRLIDSAIPREPGFPPTVRLGMFEAFAADADWLVQTLLARNTQLERTIRADLAAQFRVESDNAKARRDDPGTTGSINRRNLIAHHDGWAYAMRAAARLVDPVPGDSLVKLDVMGQTPKHTASELAEHLEDQWRSRSR